MVVEETKIQKYQQESMTLKSMAINEMDYSRIGRTVKAALVKAQSESRLIVGLSAAVTVLSKAAEGTLFCLLAEPQDGDSATHMHEVLLEAFCYENDIYVIKVDCPIKLSRILGKTSIESCCLIQKTWTGDNNNEELLNKPETLLVDYCEAFWDSPTSTVIKLPNRRRLRKTRNHSFYFSCKV
uniref:Ribosomal protein eL8/eL30/eS12/Gadd45 domain-containing protein n=1 Tax=Glossina austeni TaxID=7395 RepID=A0A1A9UDF0_GLOAU